MVLGLLLLFLCESRAATTISTSITTMPTTTKEETLSLTLVATPDYPVAEGQEVVLRCSSVSIPSLGTFSWECLKNQTWILLSNGTELRLTKPEETGVYRCCAKSLQLVSQNHTVYIVAMLPTVADHLGITGFVFSLLCFIVILVFLLWLGWKALSATATTSIPTAKDFPGPEKVSKGGLPQNQADGDVYMNYSTSNQAYSDLDPTNMTVDNVYSSLS
ncbi:hypothetical protein Q5P01_020151 [Channa striata]|uniref:Ig-like domain-containing protein n=1 Tax=Channa striata TaxID=64152 RepID=A0AA88S0X2_CHASR|nr:hypothetical protein Q5P01_020151 [Channa striata]